MKKKLLILLPIFIFALVFMYKMPTYATTYNKEFVEYTLPDQYIAGYSEDYSGDFYTEYSYETDDGYYNEAAISCGQWFEEPGFSVPTEESLGWQIDSVKTTIECNDGLELNGEPEGKMIEINGVPGYQVLYTTTEKDTGLVMSHGTFVLTSDYTSCWFNVQGPENYAYSNEVKQMVNSIKINDTTNKYAEYKGIPFTDVSMSSWYYNAVKFTYQNNIISGLDKTTFGPNEKLTRGMIVTILWRMENAPQNDGKSKFTDVASNKWYAQAVKWAAENKIVSGYSGTTKFGPADNVTRQDLAVILRNYANYKGKSITDTADLSNFTDAGKISNYAKPAMQWAVAKGVITGNAKTKTLNPKGNATRAETAAMIQKYCKNVGK